MGHCFVDFEPVMSQWWKYTAKESVHFVAAEKETERQEGTKDPKIP